MTTANDRSNSSTARLTSASASRVPVAGGTFCRAQISHDVVDQLKHVVGRRVGGAATSFGKPASEPDLVACGRTCSATAPAIPPSNKGHDFRLLQDFMGHRDPRHTSRYTRTASRRFEGLWK